MTRSTDSAVPSTLFDPLCRPKDWAGLPITLEYLPGDAEFEGYVAPSAAIAVVRSGMGKRWYQTAGRTQELRSAPSMIGLCDAGFRVDHARWVGTPGEVIAIQLPAPMVTRLLLGDTRPLELPTRLELFDSSLAQLVNALWDEAVHGSPLGPTFAEGLSIAMVSLLSNRYGANPPIAEKTLGKFGPRDRARLHALIEEHLSGDLRIARLADAVSMSPHHFARVFKATFGQPVHAFILQRRIEAAGRALRDDTERPVAEVAGEFGFSSQAHFTEAFRRLTGTTPARWRKGA